MNVNDIYHYKSASVALEELEKAGFSKDYNEHEEDIIESKDAFKILQVYRYEGMTNPGDESTVYGIENTTTHEKGFYMAGNSAFEDNEAAKVLLDLEITLKQQLNK